MILFYLFLTACSGESTDTGTESVKNRKWSCLPKKDGTGFYVAFEISPDNFNYFNTLYSTEKKCKEEMNRLRGEAKNL